MASESQFYGLQKIGPNESLSTNGYAFTTRNIDAIDSLLNRSLNHVHTGADDSASDPAAPLGALLNTTGGVIPAGTTIRYRFTWIDSHGAESGSSPETVVVTADAVGSPSPPSLSISGSGGTLLIGSYMYALTAYVGTNNFETTMGGSKAFASVVSGTTSSVNLLLPSVPGGASGFNIYRRAPGESVYSYLDSVDMSVATPPSSYTDTGAVSPNCNRHPPNVNLTNASNSVTLSIPGATPSVPDGYTWKVYRTYVAGNWTNSLLSWVVEETTEGSGVITTTFTDVGNGTGFGRPPTASEFSPMPSKIDLTDGNEVQGALPLYSQHKTEVVTFAQGGTLETGTGSFVWVCEYADAEIQRVRATLGRGSTPASSDVIIDVVRADASDLTSWTSIWNSPSDRATISVGDQTGASDVSRVTDFFTLSRGDALSVDIVQVGGGATPTDYDLTINIVLVVRDTADSMPNPQDDTYEFDS